MPETAREYEAVEYEAVFAEKYNGGAVCCRAACDNPARWMPIVEFRPEGDDAHRLPTALLGLGLCDVHQQEFKLADIDLNGLLAHVRRACSIARLADPAPDRTTLAWCQVAKEA